MSRLTREHSKQVCACCDRLKLCHMYTIQTGDAVWICDDCREGKKS